ncbi:hypothetical protein [Methylobrevis pamukkalensis]|uniref:Uncharacterized protein n=1 Tax=Methylobrevis pamukkalensis TaxID=1439726 RepID=A0A1E3GYU4_9HYPH|nr:hypothetical protein [Methylobrevis pamukkalensis]ODN69237.1 hypothetical protein A6302_03458 [Methylobrevis pamukkalensis]
MIEFKTFKTGPAAAICERLGFDISSCTTWDEFTTIMDRAGSSSEDIQRLAASLSKGEKAVLCSVLAAADFMALADEIADGEFWQLMDFTNGEQRQAIASAISHS